MKLSTHLVEAFKESNITKTELAWRLRVSDDRLNELFNGSDNTIEEEDQIIHFILKIKGKKFNFEPAFKNRIFN